MPSHVIYARKSTESEDRQVLSIDSQTNELRTLAQRRGIAVAETLTETRSAKAPGRPVFGALMKRVDRGEIHGILCWKMDRLARNHLDTGAILQALADGKLQEVITSDRTYTRDGNDRFMGNFELGIATKFIDDLRANVKRGNRARFQRGWINYRPPQGYMNDIASKTIVKDPERFDLVRRMWELVLTGAYRPSQVVEIANNDWGFRTRPCKRIGGNPLSVSALYRMLGNPFYMGVIHLKTTGETYPGAHPATVTREEFDRVQDILGRPGRPRSQTHDFPFTGLIHCGSCGATVTAEEHVKPSGRKYVYYRCTHRRTDADCHEPAIPERALEEQIASVLDRLTMSDRVLSWVLERVSRELNKETGRAQSARKLLEESLAAARREGQNILSLRLRDVVPDEVYLARKREIEDRQRSLEAKVAQPTRSSEELAALTARTFNFAAEVAGAFRKGTAVQRRMILEAVGLNPELLGRTLRMQLKKPLSMVSEAVSSRDWQACIRDVRTWIRDTTEYFALPDLENVGNPRRVKNISIYQITVGAT